MDAAPKIKSSSRVIPMIYAYSTPGVPNHNGWLKIGYTERNTKRRINEQAHTLDVDWKLEWQDNAIYKDGSGKYFEDSDFHNYLTRNGVERKKGTEWFKIDVETSKRYFQDFAAGKIQSSRTGIEYALREEQARAVAMTKKYFESLDKKDYGTEKAEFLWNAKPRFGKTLITYDLIRQMGFKTVLIVTNRPSISTSWADEFYKFIGWRDELYFVSENDALRDRPGVISREKYETYKNSILNEHPGMVAFESLAGLKGSTYFGGDYPKLRWITEEKFDLLIIDEAHEGVDTTRTEEAFRCISRKYTLHLSATPFKALANERFSEEQIFNWSYVDEQEAKKEWKGEGRNPYEIMPQLAMFTYQLSPMICDEIKQGTLLPETGEAVDYAFDLNEFFSTYENGEFVHKDEIKKFLHSLSTRKKYPFSTPEKRDELSHTIWILDRVKSVKALASLLQEDEVFGDYEIIVAAGDGKLDSDEGTVKVKKAFDRVREATEELEKTITLSVGQLTVGVTIRKWSGVLMLCNMKSPAAYIQAMFRAQNPCKFQKKSSDGKPMCLRKETAYVFDFDPARTLTIYDEFAQSLSAKNTKKSWRLEDQEENNRELLNYFPVFGEGENGEMVKLDAAQVLSIPRNLKSQDVVRRGFMSNFLFKNISNVFGAPGVVREILQKLTPVQVEPKYRARKDEPFSGLSGVPVNPQTGEVEIPKEVVIGKAKGLFGKKIYRDLEEAIKPHLSEVAKSKNDISKVDQQIENLRDVVKENIKSEIVAPAAESYGIGGGKRTKIEKQVDNEIDDKFKRIRGDYVRQIKIAKEEHNRKCKEADTQKEIVAADRDYERDMKSAFEALAKAADEVVKKTIEDKPRDLVEQMERLRKEEEKNSLEEGVRAHLRGFSRSIPSFIMAYDSGDLTLRNFDKKTEPKVFEEVTGITVKDFRFLRDGGTRKNESGEKENFEGGLFDEVVFNDSVVEFRKKRKDLADYFDEDQTEDIFSYIPPQKTNQVFTPKSVVKRMVDELEKNNPGCFDDPTKTFADLYMKSGQYITEIVKRLFRSKKMKRRFPDDKKRIRHILTKQVYGMAPTRIIYLIATNYIFGSYEKLKSETKNFVQADAAKAAQNGTLLELVEKSFPQI